MHCSTCNDQLGCAVWFKEQDGLRTASALVAVVHHCCCLALFVVAVLNSHLDVCRVLSCRYDTMCGHVNMMKQDFHLQHVLDCVITCVLLFTTHALHYITTLLLGVVDLMLPSCQLSYNISGVSTITVDHEMV